MFQLVCFTGEAWCLARNHDGIVYIQHESEVTEEQPHVAAAKGFDFSAAQHTSASGFASFSPSQGEAALVRIFYPATQQTRQGFTNSA